MTEKYVPTVRELLDDAAAKYGDKTFIEFMRGGKKHVEHTQLSAALPERMRLFNVLTLIPGASIGYHVHENETEMFYFIEGNGRVQDDDAFFDISAGDCMATFSGHGHAVENTGDTDLVILAAIVKD